MRSFKFLGAAAILGAMIVAPVASGAVYRWDNGEKISNFTLGPGVNINGGRSSLNLDYADLADEDLQGATISASLQHARFVRSDLTNASLRGELTNADFSGSILKGANLRAGFPYNAEADLTKDQFYSTISYQIGELGAINLSDLNLSEWNLSGLNLTGAALSGAIMTNTEFTNAIIEGVDFSTRRSIGDFYGTGISAMQLQSTASHRDHNLRGINFDGNNLRGADFFGQDLTGATLSRTGLGEVNFTNALITNTNFVDAVGRGFTEEQLASTANYRSKSLTRVDLSKNVMRNWDFSSLILTSTLLESADLANARFSNTDLTDVSFAGSKIDRADFRGAIVTDVQLRTQPLAPRYHIFPDGHVEGMQGGLEPFVIWDYNGESSIPILVRGIFRFGSDRTLRMVFEDTEWGSTIGFDSVSEVRLPESLELLLDDDALGNYSLVGSTFRLFNWDGVSPFGTMTVSVPQPGVSFDTSNLMTTGEVTLLTVPEPATFGLLLLGGVFGWSRRSRIGNGRA